MISSGEGNSLITARTLTELKAEVLRRADRGIPPLLHVKPDDVRAALARLDTLGRDAWASAFIDIADRAAKQAGG
jgi:hypothetical protein